MLFYTPSALHIPCSPSSLTNPLAIPQLPVREAPAYPPSYPPQYSTSYPDPELDMLSSELRYRRALQEARAAEQEYNARLALARAQEEAVRRQRQNEEAVERARVQQALALQAEVERLRREQEQKHLVSLEAEQQALRQTLAVQAEADRRASQRQLFEQLLGSQPSIPTCQASTQPQPLLMFSYPNLITPVVQPQPTTNYADILQQLVGAGLLPTRAPSPSPALGPAVPPTQTPVRDSLPTPVAAPRQERPATLEVNLQDIFKFLGLQPQPAATEASKPQPSSPQVSLPTPVVAPQQERPTTTEVNLQDILRFLGLQPQPAAAETSKPRSPSPQISAPVAASQQERPATTKLNLQDIFKFLGLQPRPSAAEASKPRASSPQTSTSVPVATPAAAPATTPAAETTSQDVKGKGKETEAPASPFVEELLKQRLEKRFNVESEQEIKDTLQAIFNSLHDQGDPGATHGSSSKVTVENAPTPTSEGADLSRAPALAGAAAAKVQEDYRAHRRATSASQTSVPAPLSTTPNSRSATPTPTTLPTPLSTISNVRFSLETLKTAFHFPFTVEFDSAGDELAYTPVNAPVRAYEHALNGLLAQLDAVESEGDEDVRVRRREVVREVELALEEVEEKINVQKHLKEQGDSAPEMQVPVPAEEDKGSDVEAPTVPAAVEKLVDEPVEEAPAQFQVVAESVPEVPVQPVPESSVVEVADAADAIPIPISEEPAAEASASSEQTTSQPAPSTSESNTQDPTPASTEPAIVEEVVAASDSGLDASVEPVVVKPAPVAVSEDAREPVEVAPVTDPTPEATPAPSISVVEAAAPEFVSTPTPTDAPEFVFNPASVSISSPTDDDTPAAAPASESSPNLSELFLSALSHDQFTFPPKPVSGAEDEKEKELEDSVVIEREAMDVDSVESVSGESSVRSEGDQEGWSEVEA